tara:strand:+ start:129 stop:542 length:414 start_codon:yes stop_codon:yes gene_type:complete
MEHKGPYRRTRLDARIEKLASRGPARIKEQELQNLMRTINNFNYDKGHWGIAKDAVNVIGRHLYTEDEELDDQVHTFLCELSADHGTPQSNNHVTSTAKDWFSNYEQQMQLYHQQKPTFWQRFKESGIYDRIVNGYI